MNAPPEQQRFDILIIGAGLAGSCLAHSLSTSKISCCVIDTKAEYPENFRADKLEHNQIAALRELQLDQFVLPKSAPIGVIQSYEDGSVKNIDTIDQYGFAYTQTVNNLRSSLPTNAPLVIGKIVSCETSKTQQSVTLKDGRIFTGRLIVLATGGAGKNLLKTLGLKRKTQSELSSLNFGFDVCTTDGSSFNFNGFNYHAENQSEGANYVTLFPIGNTMKVNIFTQWSANEKKAKAMKADPLTQMPLYFSNLYSYTGTLKLASNVQVFPTSYYRVQKPAKAGLVVIADEYQSVSPATGKGLDKLTTDVALLSKEYIPNWISGSEICANSISAFYNNPIKVSADLKAYEEWHYYRNLTRGQSFGFLEKCTFKFNSLLNRF